MSGKTFLGALVMLVAVAALILLTQPLAVRVSAGEKEKVTVEQPKRDGKQNAVSVHVVIEEVDLSANTITARSTLYVIPPHDNVGGVVFSNGTTDGHKDQTTKYVRLPVMPQAKIAEKNPKVGQLAILRLKLLQAATDCTFVVVGIEEFTGLERIGVSELD